jgi:opacity protein-like surface antigen
LLCLLRAQYLAAGEHGSSSGEGAGIFVAMKKLLLLGACLVALASSPAMAQATTQAEVDVTVVRVTANYARTRVTVTRPGGKDELLEFENDNQSEKRQPVGGGFQQLVAGLYQQGYQLASTFDTQMGPGSSAAILLFVRKK